MAKYDFSDEKDYSKDALLITCKLAGPVAGEVPELDSILTYQSAMLNGMANKITKSHRLIDAPEIPIPLVEATIGLRKVYRCSSPIYRSSYTTIEHIHKSVNSQLAAVIAENEVRNLMVSSGPYKKMRDAVKVSLIKEIRWFAVGKLKPIKRLLNLTLAVGQKRNMGYGKVLIWDVQRIDFDASIFAVQNGRKILMRPIPLEESNLPGLDGWKKGYGAYRPPYWHPDNYTEIAVPC